MSIARKLAVMMGFENRMTIHKEVLAVDLYELMTVIKKPGGLRVSFYKTDISCGCQGDLKLVFIPTEKEKLSKGEIVDAIETGNCTFLR